MTGKIWIIIDDEIMAKLYQKQSRGLVNLNKDYPMRVVVNDVLRAGFREEEETKQQ